MCGVREEMHMLEDHLDGCTYCVDWGQRDCFPISTIWDFIPQDSIGKTLRAADIPLASIYRIQLSHLSYLVALPYRVTSAQVLRSIGYFLRSLTRVVGLLVPITFHATELC